MKQIKWSHSLDKNVRICRRKAFLTGLFACHQARDGSPRREAYLLKQAIDVPLWRGNVVHFAIEEHILPALKKGEQPDFIAAQEWALKLIDRQVEFSKDERYRRESKTAAGYEFCVLRADFNGTGITKEEIEQVKTDVILSLYNLETRFGDLLDRAKLARKIEIEKEIRIPLDDQIRIEVRIDFIFTQYDNRVVIVDWKAAESLTGNAREQLHAYAYAAIKSNFWQYLDCEDVELIEVNLMTGESFTYSFTEDDLADVDDRMFAGSQLLKPIFERSVDKCVQEDFAVADSPGACALCVVKEMCNGKLLSKTTGIQSALPFEFV